MSYIDEARKYEVPQKTFEAIMRQYKRIEGLSNVINNMPLSDVRTALCSKLMTRTASIGRLRNLHNKQLKNLEL